MYILNRLLAIFLGITVLPLRILAYNALFAMIALLIGVGVIIGLPILLAAVFNNKGMPLLFNFLLTSLILFPVIAAITTIALATLAAYLIYNTVIHMLESFWLGFKNGLIYGMDGFWSTLNSQHAFGQDASLRFRAFLAGIEAEDLIDDVDFDGFQRVVGELQDVVVVHEDLEVPDLQSKEPRTLTAMLSNIELKQIEGLIEQFTKSKEPLPLEKKKQLDALKSLCTQYKDLSRKLEEVRSALVSNDKDRIKDELITYNDVETPILLVKQYKKEEQWHNFPAASYVTDKQSLLHWLKQSPKHPLNKDLLKNPEPYHGMETKYIWYELTAKDCSSQELGEAAAQMRILSKVLLSELSGTQRMNLGVGSSSHSFFGIVPVINSDIPQLTQGDLPIFKCS